MDTDIGQEHMRQPVKWEVEQKYIIHDVANLTNRLQELGFCSVREEVHTDVYYRHPCRDFRKTDEAFRLRRVNDKTLITYKGKRLQAAVKTRPEIELDLVSGQYDLWRQLLESLGFRPLPAVKKQRRIFLVDEQQIHNQSHHDIVVTVDKVEQLGRFAELELIVDDPNRLPEAHARIQELGGRLDLVDVQPLSYLSQLMNKLGIE